MGDYIVSNKIINNIKTSEKNNNTNNNCIYNNIKDFENDDEYNNSGSSGSSWLSFLNEIIPEEQQPESNIIDDNENYIKFINCNSNDNIKEINNNSMKDIRNSWVFKEYPEETIFSDNTALLKAPLIEGIKPSAEDSYTRRLALRKNRFSLENQDYYSSLKLKLASDEIDKLLFFLNTPRDLTTGSNSPPPPHLRNNAILEEDDEDCDITSEDDLEFSSTTNSYIISKYSSITCSSPTSDTSNYSSNITFEEQHQQQQHQQQQLILKEDIIKKSHSSPSNIYINDGNSDDLYENLDFITNDMMDEQFNNSNIKGKEEVKEFIEIVDTFMKLEDPEVFNKELRIIPTLTLYPPTSYPHTIVRNEIKMDHNDLLEFSIECEILEECPICLNEIDSINVFKFYPCDHRYCVDCIRQYFTDLIFRQTEVLCPFPKCDSLVHDLKIKDIVGLTIFKKFEVYKYLKNFKGDNIIYCIGCQNPIPYKSIAARNCITSSNGSGSSSGKKSNVVKCDISTCLTEHCIECLSLSHPNKTCEENQKEIRENLSPDELKTLKYLELNQIKQCPKCGIHASKADGCEYVMCLTCNYQFCFLCLDPHDHNLGTHVHGARYQEEIITSDNYYLNIAQRANNHHNKGKKIKKVCRNVLIGGGVILASPLIVAAAAIAVIPYGIYFIAKKSKEKRKKKKNKLFVSVKQF